MADVGTGLAIVFGTSGFTAEITDVNGQGISRESINTSHHGSTIYHAFMPSDLVDPGELTMEFSFDPDEQPPVTSATETITITFPLPAGGVTAATLAASGFVTSWEWGAPLEEKMTATATIKWTGTPVWTDST